MKHGTKCSLRKRGLRAAVGLILFAAFSPASAQCGHERITVKDLSDPDTSSINFAPVETTVQKQARLPVVSPGPDAPRRNDEKQVYRVTGYILEYKLEADDGDIHLVLKDPDSAVSIIAEIPNPDCPMVQGTSHAEEYRAARKWISDNLGEPTHSFRHVNPPKLVTITGVGYYDPYHGQTGAAPSNREIHPLLSIH